MECLKLDFHTTKLIYNKYKESIRPRECYNNTYNMLVEVYLKDKILVKNYSIAYGYIEKKINGEYLLFRHAFIVNRSNNTVIDVTACLWEGVELNYMDYNYYIFKEYTVADEYLNALSREDYMSGLYNECHKEELDMYNKLVQKGSRYNSSDHMELVSRTYGHDYVLNSDIHYNEQGIIVVKK